MTSEPLRMGVIGVGFMGDYVGECRKPVTQWASGGSRSGCSRAW